MSKISEANNTIMQMVRSINQNKPIVFYQHVENYLKKLPVDDKFYESIKSVISERQPVLRQLDQLSTDVKNLVITAPLSEDNVFLSDSVKDLIQELTVEWSNAQLFKSHNLPVRNKIIFHGATGNGKTTMAKYIARHVKLPFIEVKSTSIVSSTLGASADNVCKILTGIKEPCILFWDEIDSIGLRRHMDGTGSSAGVENDRMVNAFLVNLEKLSPDVVLIGATNHLDKLDPAFLRRFDVKFELPNPLEIEKHRFATQLMDYHSLPQYLLPESLNEQVNYSEIKDLILGVARKFVLETVNSNKYEEKTLKVAGFPTIKELI